MNATNRKLAVNESQFLIGNRTGIGCLRRPFKRNPSGSFRYMALICETKTNKDKQEARPQTVCREGPRMEERKEQSSDTNGG